MFSVADFESHARAVLGKKVLDFYSSGANHQQTLRNNVEAFKRYRIRPRVLRDVSNLDTRVSLFGEEVAFPICVAPTGLQRMAHPDGEVATARASTSMNTCMVLSIYSTASIEEVAEAGGRGLRWFQIYLFKDKQVMRELTERAERSGYKAIVLTVDSPSVGKRLADARNQFNLPSHLSFLNFTSMASRASAVTKMPREEVMYRFTTQLFDPALTWEAIDWLRSVTKLPILLKGILTAEDALEAVKHDIQGIIVSNHGGRQLDGVPATIDVLPEVVEAVGGRVEVFLDGGVREGTDVLKALALGARAVFVGRPVLWGLAYNGSEGVEQVLQILKDEFRLAMMLSGCAKLSDIKPGNVVHESYYKFPSRSKL